MENLSSIASTKLERFSWDSRALEVLYILESASAVAYFVGGAVRNILLDRAISDYDIASSATPEEVSQIFPASQLIATGLQHGTYTVNFKGLIMELTTFRIDGKYSDSRRPDEVFYSRKIEDDLRRRDFTINALAYSPIAEGEKLIDLHGGLADLGARLIRAVGDPRKRFEEDALRILRAIRLAAELNFQIEETTIITCNAMATQLEGLAAERITTEIWRLLAAEKLVQLALSCKEVWCQVLPDLAQFSNSAYQDQVRGMDELIHAADIRLVWLLRGTDALSLENLRLSRKQRHTIERLRKYTQLDHLSVVSRKKALGDLGQEEYKKLLSYLFVANFIDEHRQSTLLAEAAQWLSDGLCLNLATLAVNGKDLEKIGLRRGKKMGRILALLLDEVLSDRIKNDAPTLLARASELRKSN